jgi:hypothetical protein
MVIGLTEMDALVETAVEAIERVERLEAVLASTARTLSCVCRNEFYKECLKCKAIEALNGPAEPNFFRIFVNGKPVMMTSMEFSYNNIVRLAYENFRWDTLYTVSYAHKGQRGGTILPDQKIRLEPGMTFNVAVTGNA